MSAQAEGLLLSSLKGKHCRVYLRWKKAIRNSKTDPDILTKSISCRAFNVILELRNRIVNPGKILFQFSVFHAVFLNPEVCFLQLPVEFFHLFIHPS